MVAVSGWISLPLPLMVDGTGLGSDTRAPGIEFKVRSWSSSWIGHVRLDAAATVFLDSVETALREEKSGLVSRWGTYDNRLLNVRDRLRFTPTADVDSCGCPLSVRYVKSDELLGQIQDVRDS